MAGTRKSKHCAVENLKAFFHRHKTVFYWTFTFAELLVDKEVAEARFKPLRDKIARAGGEELHFWELQKRGAWHVHLVTDIYLDVNELRPWMVERGWGPIMKVIRVQSPTAWHDGHWVKTSNDEERLIAYLVKYLTKAFKQAHRWTKAWGGSSSARTHTTSFRWVPWIRPGAYLFNWGQDLFRQLVGRSPRFCEMTEVLMMGYYASGWAEIDPWYFP